MTFKNVVFNVWDVGGQHKLRALWKHYYKGSAPEIRRANARAFTYSFDNVLTTFFSILGVGGVIFVIDSADKDRIQEGQGRLPFVAYK